MDEGACEWSSLPIGTLEQGKTISWSEIKAAYDVKEVGACGDLGN